MVKCNTRGSSVRLRAIATTGALFLGFVFCRCCLFVSQSTWPLSTECGNFVLKSKDHSLPRLLAIQWQPTLVFLPGEFHGQRRLMVYSPQGHKESDITE